MNILSSHLELRLDILDQAADSLPRGVPLLRAARPLLHLRRAPWCQGRPGQEHAQGHISLQLYREKLGQKIFKLSQVSCWIQAVRSPQPPAAIRVRGSGGGRLQQALLWPGVCTGHLQSSPHQPRQDGQDENQADCSAPRWTRHNEAFSWRRFRL